MGEQYKRVYCIMLEWQESDIKESLDQELDDLHKTLRIEYNFSVVRIGIPSKSPEDTVDKYLAAFYRAINGTSGLKDMPILVILFYSGHGCEVPPSQSNKEFSIAGYREFDWKKLEQRFIEHSMYDHLLLIDACYAGNAVPRGSFVGLDPTQYPQFADLANGINRVNQFTRLHALTAADQEVVAYTGSKSFTRCLDKALQDHLALGTPFDVASLFSTMSNVQTAGSVVAPNTRWMHFPISPLAISGPHTLIGRLSKAPLTFPRTGTHGLSTLQKQSDRRVGAPESNE